MPGFAIFWGELTLQAHLLKWQQTRYSFHLSSNSKKSIYVLCCSAYARIFLDVLTNTVPCRVREFRQFSEKSDVYSFGVFLLELLSGKEAIESPSPDSNQNMVEWVGDS